MAARTSSIIHVCNISLQQSMLLTVEIEARYRKSVSRTRTWPCQDATGKDSPAVAHTPRRKKTAGWLCIACEVALGQIFRLGQRLPDRAHLVACLDFQSASFPCSANHKSRSDESRSASGPQNLLTSEPSNHRRRRTSDRTTMPRARASKKRNVWNRKACRLPGR
jgi:hypothetical protein